MRLLLKKILEILDGTPAGYGKKQRGQSVVELALVSPLIVILLAGMVEIGWFARNYMILLEVSRVGARTGTVQQNELSPVNWDEAGTLVNNNPAIGPDMNFDEWVAYYRNCNSSPGSPARFGFYNFLSCIMLRSMNPLEFRSGVDEDGVPYPDDVVISAFSVQAVDPAGIPGGIGGSIETDINWPLERDDDASNDTWPQAIVVGRYPTSANECHYAEGGAVQPVDQPLEGRDPFDWIDDGGRTLHPANGGIPPANREDRHYLELADPDSELEKQRGFVWIGKHEAQGTDCLGSEFTLEEVEDLVNLVQFDLDADQRQYVTSQGLILVELWWQHEAISQFVGLSPVISPVFGILGTDTTISVWAAFPLPQVEPRIDFDQ